MAHIYIIEKGDYEGGKSEAVTRRKDKAITIASDMVAASTGRWKRLDPDTWSEKPFAVWQRDIGGEYVVIRRLEVQ